jgi:hypothetical protein
MVAAEQTVPAAAALALAVRVLVQLHKRILQAAHSSSNSWVVLALYAVLAQLSTV